MVQVVKNIARGLGLDASELQVDLVLILEGKLIDFGRNSRTCVWTLERMGKDNCDPV